MSSYFCITKNPKTKHWEQAIWLDDYFGRHSYGVKFPDGAVYDPRHIDLKTKEPKLQKQTKQVKNSKQRMRGGAVEAH